MRSGVKLDAVRRGGAADRIGELIVGCRRGLGTRPWKCPSTARAGGVPFRIQKTLFRCVETRMTLWYTKLCQDGVVRTGTNGLWGGGRKSGRLIRCIPGHEEGNGMATKRRPSHSASSTARVATEALRGERAIQAIAASAERPRGDRSRSARQDRRIDRGARFLSCGLGS